MAARTSKPKASAATPARASSPRASLASTQGRARAAAASGMVAAMASYVADEGLECGSKKDHLPNDFVEPQFPTGSVVLDHVLGFDGGIHHHGRCLMAQGPEHTGKTTLCMYLGGAFQSFYGEPVTIFDYERTLRVEYAWACGLNPSKEMTYIIQPSNVRKSIALLMNLLEKDLCRCFIFDSINMMIPDIKLEDVLSGKRMVDEKTVGEHARFMQDFFKLVVPMAAQKDALLLFVNQQSTKIATNVKDQRSAKWAGGVTNVDYDVKGGKAPKQFASYQIETTKGAAVEGAGLTEKADDVFLYEHHDLSTGVAKSQNILRNHIRVLKNKVTAGGYREFDFYLRPGGGIDDWISVRALAKHYNFITFLGKKAGYRVGTEENVLAIYPSKNDAIRALVVDQDMAVLVPLREMVVEAIKADNVSFRFNPSVADRLAAGENEIDLEDAMASVPDDSLLGEAVDA